MEHLADTILSVLMTNPVVQGAVISLVIARLRVWFATLDKMAKDPQQVKIIQFIVLALSTLATLASAWANGNLEHVDMTQVTALITTVVAALGTHQLGKDIKDAKQSG